MRIALIIAIALLISTAWEIICAQTPSTTVPLRHTVGFPSDLEDLLKLLEMLNTSSIEDIERYRDVLEDIGRTYPETSNITKALETYIDMREINSRTPVKEIYSSIDSAMLKEMLKDIVYRYSGGKHIDRAEIESFLNTVQELYNSHMISDEDLLRALSILRAISYSEGYQEISSAIDNRVSSIAMRAFNELLNIASSSKNLEIPKLGYPQSFWRAPEALPIISAPSISFALPHIVQSTYPYILAILVIAIAIGIGITIYRRFGRRLIFSINRRFSAMKGTSIGIPISSKVIENYWRAVRIVEIRTGRHRYDWQTHREYEQDVGEKLGDLGKAFSELTKIYEVVRYGGEDDSKYTDSISNILRRLEAS